MEATQPVKLRLGPDPLIEVGGVDVTDAVSGVELSARPNTPPELVLFTSAADLDVEGQAVIYVARDDIGAALAEIDPTELEASALNHLPGGFGGEQGDVGRAWLTAIAELLDS